MSPTNKVTTVYKVPSSATSITLMQENVGRLALSIHNDSKKKLYIKFGPNVSLTSFTTIIPPDGYFALPFTQCYTGRVDGFWETADGQALLTEMIG
jgi:hypothetical protein